jgi:hypothetical protein
VNGRRTRLELDVVALPRTFLGGLAEMVGVTRRDLREDLSHMQDLIETMPDAVRATRLAVGQPVPDVDADALVTAPAPARTAAMRPSVTAQTLAH